MGFLGVIDLPAPGQDFGNSGKIYRPAMIALLLRYSPTFALRFLRADTKEKLGLASLAGKRALEAALWPFRRAGNLLTGSRPEPGPAKLPDWIFDNPEYLHEYTIANRRRMTRYRISRYDHRITVFVATTVDSIASLYRLQDPKLGWDRVAADVEPVLLEGDHDSNPPGPVRRGAGTGDRPAPPMQKIERHNIR